MEQLNELKHLSESGKIQQAHCLLSAFASRYILFIYLSHVCATFKLSFLSFSIVCVYGVERGSNVKQIKDYSHNQRLLLELQESTELNNGIFLHQRNRMRIIFYLIKSCLHQRRHITSCCSRLQSSLDDATSARCPFIIASEQASERQAPKRVCIL